MIQHTFPVVDLCPGDLVIFGGEEPFNIVIISVEPFTWRVKFFNLSHVVQRGHLKFPSIGQSYWISMAAAEIWRDGKLIFKCSQN